MFHLCFTCFRHIARACVLLVVLVAAVEFGLRFREQRESLDPAAVTTESLLVCSRESHHELRPLQETKVLSPDSGEPVSVRTNSFGLRGPEPVVPRPSGVFRVVCLGDETLLGLEVPEESTVAGRLQVHLQAATRMRVEVINAGVPGYCPLLEYLQFKHRLQALEPDLVVLQLDMTDVSDDRFFRRLTKLSDDGMPLTCPNAAVDPPVSPIPMADDFHIARWLKRSLGRRWNAQDRGSDLLATPGEDTYAWLDEITPYWRIHVRHMLESIRDLHELTRSRSVPCLLVLAPAPWQVVPDSGDGAAVRTVAGVADGAMYSGEAALQVIQDYAAEIGLPVCAPLPSFRAADAPAELFLTNVPRLSARGHDLLADTIARSIRTHVSGLWLDDGGVSPRTASASAAAAHQRGQ